MQFGTFLPTYWTDYGASTVRTAVEEAAQAAEALGYASVWANDHVIAPASQASMGHIIEPLITLASLVHLVPRLHLGTSALILPQRHAVVVAKQVAALDVLCSGRFLFGIGVGWLEEEFKFLNADFDQRGAVADEATAAMQALWREPAATFYGQFYNFSDAVFFPKPARGGPPLWICGSTLAAVRRAARSGDAWNPFGIELDKFKEGVALLRTLTDGRPLPTIAAHMRMRIGAAGGPSAPHIGGSVDDVTAALQQYRQAGLEYLICDFVANDVNDLLHQMQTMAEQIVPQLRQ